MFEDKNNSSNSHNRFFKSDNDAQTDDNLNFQAEAIYYKEPEPINKKKQAKKRFNFKSLIPLGVIALVLVVFLIVFNIVFASPYKIITKTIEDSYYYTNMYLSELNNKKLNYNITKDTLVNKGKFNLTTNISELKALSKNTYEYNIVNNASKSEVDVNLNINNNNKKTDINTYLRDNKLLIASSLIDDNYHIIDTLDEDYLKYLQVNFDYMDISSILKVIKNTFISNIDRKNTLKNKTKININKREVNVLDSYYKISKQELENILKRIIDDLASDNDTVNIVSDIMGLTKKEAQDFIINLKQNDFLFNNLQDIELHVYTKNLNNRFVGFSIINNNVELFNLINSDNGNEIKGNINGFIYNALIKNNMFQINVKKDNVKIEFEAVKNNDEITSNFNFDFSIAKLGGTINFVQKRIGDKRMTTDIDLDLTLSYKSTQNIKASINNTTEVGGSTINIPDNKTILYTNTEDKEEILNQIGKLVFD